MVSKLESFAPLELVTDIEQRLEKETIDVKSFKSSGNLIEEMIKISKMEIKSLRKINNYKILFSTIKSFHSFVIFATLSTSVILPVTGIRLVVIPISSGLACRLTFSNKVIY